jgi:hypothetical protein
MMARLTTQITWIVALLAVARTGALADSHAPEPPIECTSLSPSSPCNAFEACINARFKTVLESDPEVRCKLNAVAGWDKKLGEQIEDPTGNSASSGVCRATYKRLQKGVISYRDAANQACVAGKKPVNCIAGERAFLNCATKMEADNLALNKKAEFELHAALNDAKKYESLIQEVKNGYANDMTVIQRTVNLLRAKGATEEQIVTKMKSSSSITASNNDSTGVNAKDGGASSLRAYQDQSSVLANEQLDAAATIKEFRSAANQELRGRELLSNTLSTGMLTNSSNGANLNSITSTVTGNDHTASQDSGTTTSDLIKLASSGIGLAGATASPSAAALAGLNAPGTGLTGGSSPSGVAPPSSILNSVLGGGAPINGGKAENSGSLLDNGGNAPRRNAQIDHGSMVEGSSGSGGVHAGAFVGSATTADSAAGNPASSHGMASGGSSDGESIKDSSRGPASASGAKPCGGTDCTATSDLKAEQFNGGGLGMPKFGATDSSLSPQGALENLFGPLPSLDSLMPKDPGAAGAAPALEGLFAKLELPVRSGLEAGAEAQAAAAVAPANTRSLFERVHSVYEAEIKRG